jgi:YesN/AraC family two-component response regulator
MKADAFEMHVELLDVLVENFGLKEAELLVRLAPSKDFQGDEESLQRDDAKTSSRARSDHPQVEAALIYIKKHITDSNMTVARIARALDVNASYLAHLFSLQVGVRMSRYIAGRRIELAKTLLASTSWQIKRVAYETGHGNPLWFSEVFREHTGVTPTKFRQNARSR